MGNCCKKAEVRPPVPDKKEPVPTPLPGAKVDPNAGDEAALEAQRRLKEELSLWQKGQDDEIAKLTQDLNTAIGMSEQLMKGAGLEGLTTEQILQHMDTGDLTRLCTEIDAREFSVLIQRREALEKEIERLRREKERITQSSTDVGSEAKCLEELVARMEGEDDGSSSSSETNSLIENEKLLHDMEEFYGPVLDSHGLKESIHQIRIDSANCSSQLVCNLEAFIHHMRTGDTSRYRQKPIRGLLCEKMQCGEPAHDRWNCELCAVMDVTDAPLLV